MQIVTWNSWLDRHIPYYEKHKQINRYADNPPQSVLVVDPVDRYKRKNHGTVPWTVWEHMDNEVRQLGYRTEAVFLDNDTHQRWYWAFWSADEALLAVIRLS